MAAQPIPLLTLDEYLHTSYYPDVEFVDDHVEEKNMGSPRHSLLQAELAAWFISRRQCWGIRVMTGVRTRTSTTRVRLPDVCVVRTQDVIEDRVQNKPPLIATEILSPEDRMHLVVTRLNEFLEMGVEHIWLLDPIDRVAFTYTASGLKLVQEPRLTIPDSPIYLDLPELFSALD